MRPASVQVVGRRSHNPAEHVVGAVAAIAIVTALDAALGPLEVDAVFEETAEISPWLHRGLRERGYRIVAPNDRSSPAVITIELPEGAPTSEVGRRLKDAGNFLSYNGAYSRERNWLRICLMGELRKETLAPMLGAMRRVVKATQRSKAAERLRAPAP